MARDFILQLQMEQERVLSHKTGVQEKISFVRMEYFLYAFADAHSIMKNLSKMNAQIKQLQSNIDILAQEQNSLASQMGDY